MAPEKSNCTGWLAVHDFMPPRPARLTVSGTCTFPTPGYKVILKRKVPQGINPTILLLEKVVTPPTGNVPQHPATVEVKYEEVTQYHFTEVEILPDGIKIKVQETY